MTVTNIGENSNALLCVTNTSDCCIRLRSGEWYFPNNESAVGTQGENGEFYRNRGRSVIRLNRRSSVTSPTGVFRCVIPISSDSHMNESVHIGVYEAGDGNSFTIILYS